MVQNEANKQKSKKVKKIKSITNHPVIKDVVLEEYRSNRKQFKIAEELAKNIKLDYANMTYAKNPEYILMEDERLKSVGDFAKILQEELDEKEYLYLKTYGDNNMNYHETARILNVDHKNVVYWIKKAQIKAMKLIKKNGFTIDDFKELLKPTPNNHSGDSATNIGYPFELYMKLPKDSAWDGRYGSQKSTTKQSVICAIPEYLGSCGMYCDSCPICLDSFKCTRTDAFLQNKKPIDAINKNRQIIIECINNIQEEMKDYDFSDLERYDRL